MSKIRTTHLVATCLCLAASPIYGQEPVPTRTMADDGNVKTVSVVTGAAQFDLSGTGTTPTVGLRADAEFNRWFVGEVGVTAIRPEEQFIRRATYLLPEFQLQAQLPLRVVHPYFGVGAGLASAPGNPIRSGTAPTLASAAGVRVLLPGSSTTVRAELRVRGIGENFVGAMADWTIGLGRRF